MIASFPMYDRPETAKALDRLWASTREVLGFGPATLTRDMAVFDMWTDDNLLISQTCGLPFRRMLSDKVLIIGTFDHGLPDTESGYYFSNIIARKSQSDDITDYANRPIAINEKMSQSGWAAAMSFAAEHTIQFGQQVVSGSHVASAEMVAKGEADIASIDAQTWRMIERYDACAKELKVIARTKQTPGLPLITSLGRDTQPILDALKRGVAALSPEDRDILGIVDVVHIPAERYLMMDAAN